MVQSDLINESYRELINLLKYFRHFGSPTVIGGWAVYFYNSYYGSVDIDIVGPSMLGQFNSVLDNYVRDYKYTIIQLDDFGLQTTAHKDVFHGDEKVGAIEIDAATLEEKEAIKFHEDRSKVLPYSLCADDKLRIEVTIEKDCFCYIPSKTLLLLYKIKAWRDRAFDVRTKGATMLADRLAWLQAKVAKDQSDIIAILDPSPSRKVADGTIDTNVLKKICNDYNIDSLVLHSLEELRYSNEALKFYNRNIRLETLESWVKPLQSLL